MRILFITHHYLDGVGGGTFASKAFVNAFAEIFYDVTLLFPIKDQDRSTDLSDSIRKKPVTYNIPKWKKFIHMLSGKTHRYYAAFQEIITKETFDYVVFDNSCVSFGLIDLAHKYKAKVITIHHNYEYEYKRDSSNKLLKPLILYWVKRYERESLQKSDLNLTLTQQDKLLFQNNYHLSGDNIKVLGCFEYKDKNYHHINHSKPYSFVITGNLSAKQTKESLIPWLKEYYPILQKIIPSHQLTIAGKKPSTEIKSLCKNLKIELIDTPPSMDEILNNARYYICPTALGGGIKLRVMDGLSHGLPVITHKVSARGYDVFKDKFVFEYNDTKSFLEALKRLISSKYKSNELLHEYKNIFSFKAGCNRLKEIIEYDYK